MENVRAIYVNTYAEGSRSSEPMVLTESELVVAAHGWKRSKTLIHVFVLGLETKTVDGVSRNLLFGDAGVAKVILPVEPEFSGLKNGEDPFELGNRWICGIVEDYDLKDEGKRTILINRTKGLERLRELNAERVHNPGQRATGIIRGERRGAYLLDVGGFTALLPKVWYDWDENKRNMGYIGEEFPVQIMPSNHPERIVVSRCHLIPNPNTPTNLVLERGTVLMATVAFMRGGFIIAEVYPGFQVSIDPVRLREIPRRGDKITVRVLGQNSRGYYGSMLDFKRKNA